jgi:hypothetical protein
MPQLSHLTVPKSIQTSIHRQDQAVFASTSKCSNLGFCQIVNGRLGIVIECIEQIVLFPSSWHLHKLGYVQISGSSVATLPLVVSSKGK